MFRSHNIVMNLGLCYSSPCDQSENLNKRQSFQVGGESEECCSSESGWTMYLASPMHDDDDGDGEVEDGGGEDDHNRRRRSNSDGYDEEHGGGDDDSMASDASSGPASYMGLGKCNKLEIKEEGGGRKNHRVKANCKREERKTARGSKKENKGAAASFHGNSKGRKTKTDDK